MANMNWFSSNIHHAEASRRRNSKQCVNCGAKCEHVELQSCRKPECVKIMRLVNRWSAEVMQAFA